MENFWNTNLLQNNLPFECYMKKSNIIPIFIAGSHWNSVVFAYFLFCQRSGLGSCACQHSVWGFLSCMGSAPHPHQRTHSFRLRESHFSLCPLQAGDHEFSLRTYRSEGIVVETAEWAFPQENSHLKRLLGPLFWVTQDCRVQVVISFVSPRPWYPEAFHKCLMWKARHQGQEKRTSKHREKYYKCRPSSWNWKTPGCSRSTFLYAEMREPPLVVVGRGFFRIFMLAGKATQAGYIDLLVHA